jgi:hypothetical protein
MERETPHIGSDRDAARRIAFCAWRVSDRALQFNDKARAIVAAIAAGLRVVRWRVRGATVHERLSLPIKAAKSRQCHAY